MRVGRRDVARGPASPLSSHEGHESGEGTEADEEHGQTMLVLGESREERVTHPVLDVHVRSDGVTRDMNGEVDVRALTAKVCDVA